MISLRARIAAEIVGPLEEWLNEMTRCPWGIDEKPGDEFVIFGYFDDENAAREAWAELRGAFPDLPLEPQAAALDDGDWKEAYKAHLRPWCARDLHWVPVWRRDDYPLPRGHTRLLFDAGLAFGTGDHPTTQLLALRLLDFRAERDAAKFAAASIVDVGCGSGILALSAALLGCRNVFAFDRDPEAVRVTRENFALNGLPESAAAPAHAGIEEALRGREADLLLANIQSDVLALHADDLARATAPGGVLAMSGILAAEVNDLRAAFEPVLRDLWNQTAPDELELFGNSRVSGDWCDLVFSRAAGG